jgi:hypothetical protein
MSWQEDSAVFLKDIDAAIENLDNSKIFTGLMIVLLNILSKFVTFNLSKSTETYLRQSFSRTFIVFAATWIGTRHMYTALVITALFILVADYLWNEDSCLYCLSESFRSRAEDEPPVTEEEVKRAEDLLHTYHRQQAEQRSAPKHKTNRT